MSVLSIVPIQMVTVHPIINYFEVFVLLKSVNRLDVNFLKNILYTFVNILAGGSLN